MIQLLKYLSIILVLSSCTMFSGDEIEEGEVALARVKDQILYLSDVQGIAINEINPEDSIRILNDYIQNWVKQRVLYHYAKSNLPPEKLDIEERMREYEESLIVFTYEDEYVSQKLDTTITALEINRLYNSTKSNFSLDDDIFRLRFVQLDLASPNLDSVLNYLPAESPSDWLETYSSRHGVAYNINDSLWLPGEIVARIIPEELRPGNWEVGKNYQLEDSTYLYLLNISEFKIKGSVAPLSFVRDRISKIILNKRKMELVESLSDNIFKDAAQKNMFEIYD